jgi:8-oxo-dGTP pyrophosphatase MutT (NUDIX family)
MAAVPPRNGDELDGEHPPVYAQSAVLPFRGQGADLEILVVSNQSGARWVLPKGLVEEDLSPAESAAKEAFEEGGIAGEVPPGSVGMYAYEKWGGTCEVELFLLAVDTEYDDWPERGARERRWISRQEVLKEVDPRVPRKLLKAALARAEAGAALDEDEEDRPTA